MVAILHDRAQIKGNARITPEGYFVADALVAKANNIQAYTAGELGLTDRDPNETVRLFRPESAVFAVDSLETASRLPVTLNHPVANGASVMVDAKNWREFAKGETGEEILRDGDFIRVPIRVTDAAAVDAVRSSHQEFSMGYAARIDPTPGEFNGQAYDAVVADIKYNHLAACRLARGGPELRITDERSEGDRPVKTILVDGLPVNVADADSAGATINKLVADRDAAVLDGKGARELVATRDAELATAQGEIKRLTDELANAKPSTADLVAAAAAHTAAIADAKRLGATITDGMAADEAKRAAVVARIGDKAASYDDAQVAVAFDTLVAALPADGKPDALAQVIGDGVTNVVDAQAKFEEARAARFDRFNTAHRAQVEA